MELEQKDGFNVVPSRDAEGMQAKYVTSDGVPLVPMHLSFQNYIDTPPMTSEQLYQQACTNDGITISSWEKIWIDQITANGIKYGFKPETSAMAEYMKEQYRPVIIAGSGPSLKKNAKDLKNRGSIKIVSCSHNFGFFEDLGIMTDKDYYLTLDAGDICTKEIYEGSKKTEQECWDISKDRTLLAFTGTHASLLEKWQGNVRWFGTPPPNEKLEKVFDEHVDPTVIPTFNVGGNALGACLYFARAILGASHIIFVGADFSFGYDRKFHGWDSPYDKQFAGVIPCVDVFGNRCFTWQSYWNFKGWFDHIAMGGRGNNPQKFINCTEGGILGAYPQGNIRHIEQASLKETLYFYNMPNLMADFIPNMKTKKVLLF